jgi:hypothetical protein
MGTIDCTANDRVCLSRQRLRGAIDSCRLGVGIPEAFQRSSKFVGYLQLKLLSDFGNVLAGSQRTEDLMNKALKRRGRNKARVGDGIVCGPESVEPANLKEAVQ